MDKKKIKVAIILGPTSSGKSDLALKIAKKFQGEIISADSRQVYKDMNLATGKVEGKWKKTKAGNLFYYKNVPHYLIDFADPRKDYNISHFKQDCERLIVEISRRGKLPIICGGTGFWISAVVDGLILPEVKPDEKLRKELAKENVNKLLATLEKIDPERAETVDRKNKVRLIRAIEIVKAFGKVPKISKQSNGKFEFIQFGVDWPKDVLNKKIEKRLEKRFKAGMVNEIKNLKQKYRLSWKKIQSFGLAYFWTVLFLQGKISENEMKQKTFEAEKNYAKRQRTWFKRDKRIIWENDFDKISTRLSNYLRLG